VRRYAPLAAAACLLLAFGLFMPRPGFLSAPRTAAPSPENGLAMRGAAGLGPDAPMIFLNLPPGDNKEAEPAPLPAPRVEPAALATQGAHATPLAAPARASLDPHSPRQLHLAVNVYHARGDVAEAERALREAHQRCKKELGPRHGTTQWAARQLAGVYQVALNTSDAPAGKVVVSVAAPRGKPQRHATYADRPYNPYFRARVDALRVRRELTGRPAREVVPVLVQALRTTSCPKERQALVRALGELGPAARAAVPELTERLRQSSEAREQCAILQALERIGPAAGEAAPVLAALAGDDAPTPLHHARRVEAERCCKLADHEARLAKKVLARLSGVEARVGVFDGAGLFSVGGIIETTRALRDSARHHRVAVRIETLGRGDQEAKAVLAAMGPRAIHVLLDQDGGNVRVLASQALRAQGLDPAALGRELSALCKKNEHDRVLATVLARVQELDRPGKKK
jgi:hypothetical protein